MKCTKCRGSDTKLVWRNYVFDVYQCNNKKCKIGKKKRLFARLRK